MEGGKLFRFEVRLPCGSCRDIPETICRHNSGHASVFFWLCAKCAQTTTLSFACPQGLIVQPVQQNLVHVSGIGASQQQRNF
jgi:hypothetical protein